MDIKILNRNIQDLQNHFKTLDKLPDRTLKCWSKYLMESLSAEELEKAVDLATITYGRNYDLSAKSLVELVKGSEKELVYECWSRVLEVSSRKAEVSSLDAASQWAIQKLGGVNLLGELSITKLYDLKFEFVSHWNKYRREPQEGFKPLSDSTPDPYKEYVPPSDDDFEPITREQKAQHAELLKKLKAKMGLVKNDPKTYLEAAKTSQQQLKEELGDLTVAENGYHLNLDSEFAQVQKARAKAMEKALASQSWEPEDDSNDMSF